MFVRGGCAWILPFVDLRMAIGKSESTSVVVVIARTIHDIVVAGLGYPYHLCNKEAIIDAIPSLI